MGVDSRIPFAEAIAEPLLFKKQFEALSLPQQVILKGFYGLSLNQEERLIWSMFNGFATYDELGYVRKIDEIEYTPQEYDTLVMVLGRRSGKTSGPLAFVEAYEATCGGHLDFVARRQECVLFLTAQKAEYASDFILQFVLPLLEDSPLLTKRLEKFNSDGIILSAGQPGITKKVGIRPAPPNIKAFRGPAIPVIGMDEASFWYKDSESANPDYEVERAVDKAQQQFPFRKKVIPSTPWTKQGIVWDAYNAGTKGHKYTDLEKKKRWATTMVVHAPTPAMQNPLLKKAVFIADLAKDPEAYKRETLALFMDAVDGIFTESILRRAIDGQPSTIRGVEFADREPKKDRVYVAALDPAFKRDRFAFTIFHWEPGVGAVQDLLRVWKPEGPKNPLKPAEILDEIKPLIEKYDVVSALTDQYQFESFSQLALDREITVEGITFTATNKVKIYGSALMAARNGQLKLLDDEDQFQELLIIEKTLLPQGGIHIAAPAGKHDDIATVVVLAAWRTLQLRGNEEDEKAEKEKAPDENRPAARLARHIEKKEQMQGEDFDSDDVLDIDED